MRHATPNLEQASIHAWILKNELKTEDGARVDFLDHMYLYDIYADWSPQLCGMKAAQVGWSLMATLKTFFAAHNFGLNVIYTLPTDSDRNDFVSGKVNRIIAQNSILQEWTKDKDSVEQKAIGDRLIHFRGTWTEKAAIMIPSDLNVYDERDSSKPDIVEQYATRLQHSSFKWEWSFSHPSADGVGVHRVWETSDKKEWFVTCGSCGHQDFLQWPQSIDQERMCYQCTGCNAELKDADRRLGEWRKTAEGEVSGYHISLMMNPKVSAAEIVKYYKEKSAEYFFNKVLGLPYIGGGNKLTQSQLMANVTNEDLYPKRADSRMVLGCDTGKNLHYVIGTDNGIFQYGMSPDYSEIRLFLLRFPRLICVFDQGGDLIGPRQLREEFPGRVFLCTYRTTDRKTMELVTWGKHDESGHVVADRNRTLSLVVEEFTDKRIPLSGNENDWYDYYLHWSNISRIRESQPDGRVKNIWIRNGEDHWAHATVYWRIGMSRWGGTGFIVNPNVSSVEPSITLIKGGKRGVLNLPQTPPPTDWRRIYN